MAAEREDVLLWKKANQQHMCLENKLVQVADRDNNCLTCVAGGT